MDNNVMQTFVHSLLKVQSSYRQIIQRKIREQNIDVTFEMIHVLKSLYHNNGVNQQELANLTYKDKSSLSYLLNNLEKRNLISRTEDKNDKRNKIISLTSAGRELHTVIVSSVEEIYSKIEENFNKEHVEVCINYMEELNDVIKEDRTI